MSANLRRPLAFLGATLLASVALLGIASPVSAATVTLAPGDSINAAILAAQPGDTIVLPDGIYTGAVAVDKVVTLAGATPRGAIITGAVTVTAPATITGLTLGGGVIVNAAGAGTTISNNTITGSGQLIAVIGTPLSSTLRTVVSGNTIENVGAAGQPNGLYLNNASSVDIVGNIIRNTGAVPANSVGVNVANGLGDIIIAGNTISGFENAIAVLSTAAPAITAVVIDGNTISNTTNSAVVFSNANLSDVAVTNNSFTSVGTSGPTRAAVQVGVPGLAAPAGSPGLDALVIDDNTVTTAPNGVVFSAGVVLADNESAVVSNNTFAGVTGSAIAVDPSVNASVAAPDNDLGGAAVTGNVVVTAAAVPLPVAPGLAATGPADVLPLAAGALLLLLLGTMLIRRRTAGDAG